MKDSEPVGEHLGKDEDVDDSPGLVTFESNIMIFLKKLHIGVENGVVYSYWGKVYKTKKTRTITNISITFSYLFLSLIVFQS